MYLGNKVKLFLKFDFVAVAVSVCLGQSDDRKSMIQNSLNPLKEYVMGFHDFIKIGSLGGPFNGLRWENCNLCLFILLRNLLCFSA